jgi:SpoIIAA-like
VAGFGFADTGAVSRTKGTFMIEHSLDAANSILHVRPTSSLEERDFVELAKAVDPYIEASGGLAGLIIEAPAFPGWESLAAMLAHMRFVRDHHRHIKKIAAVTDSAMGNVAEHLASHFVAAEIKRFAAGDLEPARQWIIGRH